MTGQPIIVGHWLPLTIELESPFLTRSVEATDVILDSHILRDADGEAILPGTLVKGVIRDALTTLKKRLGTLDYQSATHHLLDDLGTLFGKASGHDALGRPLPERSEASNAGWSADNQPDRGQLDIADLIAVTPEPPREDRPGHAHRLARVEIDDRLGAAREGHLQFIELPWPIGTPVTFTGKMYLRRNASCPADRAAWLIEKVLKLVPAVGAIKSAGFGKLLSVAVSPPEPHLLAPDSGWTDTDQFVELTFDRPILVNADRPQANIIRGDDVVPGAVIKGAMAQMLDAADMATQLSDALAETVVTHAFPVTDKGQADNAPRRPLPLSLTRVADSFEDVLLTEQLDAVGRKPGLHRFQTDWKHADWKAAWAAHRMSEDEPARDVRTQTAIDPDTGGADEERLFSVSAVRPEGWRWILRLSASLEAVTADQRAWLLGTLTSGLPDIGRTRAHAFGKVVPGIEQLPNTGAGIKGRADTYAFTLETPALLNDLAQLRAAPDVGRDYAAYWRHLGYRLLRFFARQKLAGGHIALRYPQRDDAYEPYLLTEPGSVFLVERLDKPRHEPHDLARWGLPLSRSVTRQHWKQCPFLPKNGFGQVRLTEHGSIPKDFQPMHFDLESATSVAEAGHAA